MTRKPNPLCSGFLSGKLVDPAILRRLLASVLSVPPGKPDGDLRVPDMDRQGAVRTADWLDPRLANDAAIAVAHAPLYRAMLVENQPRQVFRGALAERLCLLWGVNALEANLVVLKVRVQQGDGVAIGNTDNAALCLDFVCHDQQNDSQEKLAHGVHVLNRRHRRIESDGALGMHLGVGGVSGWRSLESVKQHFRWLTDANARWQEDGGKEGGKILGVSYERPA